MGRRVSKKGRERGEGARAVGRADKPAQVYYFTLSGTSMAAPQVSGVVALILQGNPNLSPNTVKAGGIALRIGGPTAGPALAGPALGAGGATWPWL